MRLPFPHRPLIPLLTAAGCCATIAIAFAGSGGLPIGGPPAFPHLVFGPSDVMTCAGAPVQFQTKAEPTHSAMTLEYQWQFQDGTGGWTDLFNDPEPTPLSHHVITFDPESRASTLLINRLAPADTGLYRCLVTANNGTALLAMPARATSLAFDVGSAGGVFGADGHLDNNDFIAFLDGFFSAANWVDLGKAGGHWGGDGLLDNNDFVAYIDLFFNQCFILHNPPEPPGIPFEPWPVGPDGE
jgi:hypothetical protein